jgi:hypothetical protein
LPTSRILYGEAARKTRKKREIVISNLLPPINRHTGLTGPRLFAEQIQLCICSCRQYSHPPPPHPCGRLTVECTHTHTVYACFIYLISHLPSLSLMRHPNSYCTLYHTLASMVQITQAALMHLIHWLAAHARCLPESARPMRDERGAKPHYGGQLALTTHRLFFYSEFITYIVHSRGVMLGDRKPIPIGVCHWTNHNSTIRKITEIKMHLYSPTP